MAQGFSLLSVIIPPGDAKLLAGFVAIFLFYCQYLTYFCSTDIKKHLNDGTVVICEEFGKFETVPYQKLGPHADECKIVFYSYLLLIFIL